MNSLEILIQTSKRIETHERLEVEKKSPDEFWASFISPREYDEMPAGRDSIELDSKDH